MPHAKPYPERDTSWTVPAAGTWLAVASVLMMAALAFHGPIAPDPSEQMARIAGGALRWAVVHWTAAAALSLYALTGLIVLSSGSRLTEASWTLTAWAVVSVGALWTVTTAVAEATVVAGAAAAGSVGTFAASWAFSAGMANGFAFLALAVAAIAENEARTPERATPAWSAHAGAAAGVASFTGWALGMWFDVGFGSLLWLVSSIAMSVWTLWFGVALMRTRVSVA